MRPNLEGTPNDNKVSHKKYQKISKNSIHCCAVFDKLTKYIPEVTVNGEQIYMGFQCRVHPL